LRAQCAALVPLSPMVILLEWWDLSPGPFREQPGYSNRPTSMNKNPRSKRIRRDRVNPDQNGTPCPSMTGLLRKEYLKRQRASAHAVALLYPSRELMICLGWFRLFKSIIAPNHDGIALEEFRHARSP
jgi:hypothetical protein